VKHLLFALTQVRGREPDELRMRPTGSPPEPPNIDRIAEQVIRAIDRRIVAERERFGRP